MFKKGQSGNPKGKPKGSTKYSELGRFINLQTDDLREVVGKVLKVLRNDKATDGIRLEAASWLRDSTLGKPKQAIDLGGKDGEPLTVQIISFANKWKK